MKTQKNFISLFLPLIIVITFSSCRNESDILTETPEDQIIRPNSKVANLISKVTMNDGSIDNIIDNLTCSTVKLPITVIANGSEEIINSVEDFLIIEDIFTEFNNDTDVLEIIFPITIILNDFSEVIVENENQLKKLIKNCDNNDGDKDEDIECIDFQYPFSVSVFNSSNELLETLTFKNDKELHKFIKDLNENDIVNIGFPITVVLSDGSEISIIDLDHLENVIEDTIDDCDERDLTREHFTQVIINQTLRIQKYKDNQSNETNNYRDYIFNFSGDGTVIITNKNDNSTIDGTWSVSTRVDGGLDTFLDFGNGAPLNKLNNKWNVKKIKDKRIMLDDRTEQEISKDELFFQQLQ
ncbi:hypothetical protein [Aquimarina macrocephali]|uniref:hypothetical protein n=1 Tax=Aquimarina macrocephali TaxID=666563 RepID=UPI003F66542A